MIWIQVWRSFEMLVVLKLFPIHCQIPYLVMLLLTSSFCAILKLPTCFWVNPLIMFIFLLHIWPWIHSIAKPIPMNVTIPESSLNLSSPWCPADSSPQTTSPGSTLPSAPASKSLGLHIGCRVGSCSSTKQRGTALHSLLLKTPPALGWCCCLGLLLTSKLKQLDCRVQVWKKTFC